MSSFLSHLADIALVFTLSAGFIGANYQIQNIKESTSKK